MTAHLTANTLNALADGELSAEQLAAAKEHLDSCSSCVSDALAATLLKTATARAGRRYETPRGFEERMKGVMSGQIKEAKTPAHAGRLRTGSTGLAGWTAAAVLLIALGSWTMLQRQGRQADIASAQHAALVMEASDLHIAMLAANVPPQVISEDRHTVKPWFQGKIPFSFNLPGNLPPDTKLDGANLTYLHNNAVAQLIYSIGRHRVSVFVQERGNAGEASERVTEHSGFHIAGFHTDDLQVMAVSDVDPARLSGLVRLIEEAQTNAHK